MRNQINNRKIMELFVLLIYLCFVGSFVRANNVAFAQGNLEVIFDAKSAKSSDDHPQKAEVPNLWCQARSYESNELLPIREAHFVRDHDKVVLPGIISNETRAILHIGTTSVLSAGRYRCEITTIDGDFVWGWLFLKMRPVFHTNHSKLFETVGDDHFHLMAPTVRVTEGETVILSCPVYGYPKPSVEWFKDDVPVASTEQITFLEPDLQIAKVEFDDEGIYSCVAKNTFAEYLDGTPREWESRLYHELKVKGSYRWIYPLLVIIVMLILLFLIIYACTCFSRYKTYNVEKRERRKKRQPTITNSENSSQQQPILGYNKNEI